MKDKGFKIIVGILITLFIIGVFWMEDRRKENIKRWNNAREFACNDLDGSYLYSGQHYCIIEDKAIPIILKCDKKEGIVFCKVYIIGGDINEKNNK